MNQEASRQHEAGSYAEAESRFKKAKHSSPPADDNEKAVAVAVANLEVAQPTNRNTGPSSGAKPSETSTTTSVLSSNCGKDDQSPPAKCGRWSNDEKLLFLYGLSVFGKGRWKKIHAYVPDRSLVQIKSHAQKVLKRLDTGENVFMRLEENRERLRVLVEEANQRIEEQEAKANLSSKKKRKRASTRKQQPLPPYTALSSSPASAWPCHIVSDILGGGASEQTTKETHPSTSSSPVPSLHSATEDHPGLDPSRQEQEEDSNTMMKTMMERRASTGSCASSSSSSPAAESAVDVPPAGTGAVFAAVAALCQLSGSSSP